MKKFTVLAVAAFLAGTASAQVINEFVANHVGTDTNEFIEFFGAPNTDFSNLTILHIEGDGSGAGTIDSVHPVGTTDANGYWCTAYMNNIIENGTITLLLVLGFTGAQGNDLDTNNDGVLDVTPWGKIIDGVGISDGGATDFTYGGAPVLTPTYDGGTLTVGGASRIPNGTDTNSTADWVRNDFDGAGLPGFPGTPVDGEALNTYAAENQVYVSDPCAGALIGDANCDGAVDFFDIDVFIDYLLNGTPPCNLCTVDALADNVLDFFDIDPFIACVLAGGC